MLTSAVVVWCAGILPGFFILFRAVRTASLQACPFSRIYLSWVLPGQAVRVRPGKAARP